MTGITIIRVIACNPIPRAQNAQKAWVRSDFSLNTNKAGPSATHILTINRYWYVVAFMGLFLQTKHDRDNCAKSLGLRIPSHQEHKNQRATSPNKRLGILPGPHHSRFFLKQTMYDREKYTRLGMENSKLQ